MASETTAYTEATPQHLTALDRANEIRLGRSALRRKVNAGDLSVADVLRESPRCVESALVADVLAWPRRWGKLRAAKVLSAASALDPPVYLEGRRVGALTERERTAVAALLEAW